MLKKIAVVACSVCISIASYAGKVSKKSRTKLKLPSYTQRYILIDYDDGLELESFEKDTRTAPSSMTKLLTLYILFSKLKSGELYLDDTMIVSEQAKRAEGSRSWLLAGSNVSVSDLIRCLIVHSGNDAAVVIAENISGSVKNFADLMNETAHMLGMHNSHFTNPSGLPDKNLYSTVKDLAILSRRLIKDFPEYYSYFAEKEFEMSGIKQFNRNALLWDDIGVDGLKTGHTNDGGYGLAASAVNGNVRLISVVNGCSSQKVREQKTKELLTRGFRTVSTYKLAKKNVPVHYADVWLGDTKLIPLVTNEDVTVTIFNRDAKSLKVYIEYDSPIKAPVQVGKEVGVLVVEYGQLQKQYKLFAGECAKELNTLHRLVPALKFMVFGRN